MRDVECDENLLPILVLSLHSGLAIAESASYLRLGISRIRSTRVV